MPEMQAHLVGLGSVDGGGLFGGRNGKGNLLVGIWAFSYGRIGKPNRSGPIAAAAINGEQDHYAVLGLSTRASSADVKRAYRLLARKFHPDVSKDLKAGEAFKSIRLAYEVLSNESARAQYDGALRFQEETSRPWKRSWSYDPEFDEGIKMYRWAELRRQMQNEKEKQQYYYTTNDDDSSETDAYEEEASNYESRGSFADVLWSSFFTLLLMETLGSRLSLTLCGLTALFDRHLDLGYKVGYLIAWILGGRGGIFLAMCLSFAIWLCGKTSSSLVAVVVVAMWVGAHIARTTPFPQGAVLALLYMSIKLQVDLS